MLRSAHSVLSSGQLGLIVLVSAVGFIMAKGDRAERIAAGLLALAWLASVAAQPLTGQIAPEIPFMMTDLVLAVGFLVLAIRHASVWIGGAMMLEGALFFLHATHMTEESHRSYTYIVGMNALSYCVLACVAGGAAASWRRRVIARRKEEPPALSAAAGRI